MPLKLLLHIGTEKTGTTLLQKWLYANKEALSEQGVFLSQVCYSENNRKLVSYCQTSLDDFTKMSGLMTLEDKAHFFQGFPEKFKAEVELASETHRAMVITSEHFHSRIRKPEEIATLKSLLEDNFESVKVICYLRPQWDLRESLYSTSLKCGDFGAIERFQRTIDSEDYYYNYCNLADFWAGAFGKDNLELRIFDRNKFVQGDLRKDFLTALPIELDASKLSYEIKSENESLSYLKSFAYRGINKTVPFLKGQGGINPVNVKWKQTLSGCETLNLGRLSDPGREDLYLQFEESNRQLAQRYFQTSSVFPKPEQRSSEEIRLTLDEVGKIVEDVAAITVGEFAAVYKPAETKDELPDHDGKLEAKLQSVTQERDNARLELQSAVRERDHAKHYPWKYLVSAIKARVSKEK